MDTRTMCRTNDSEDNVKVFFGKSVEILVERKIIGWLLKVIIPQNPQDSQDIENQPLLWLC
jgi:hypothetical protein